MEMEYLTAGSLIVTILGVFFLFPLFSSYWNRPKFVYGFLPQENENLKRIFDFDKRPNLNKLKFERSLEYIYEDNKCQLGFIVANVGRGDVKEARVMLDFWEDKITITDLHTEYLKLEVVYGPNEIFKADCSRPYMVDHEILDYYRNMDMNGNFLEFIGSMPAKTYEVILIDITKAGAESVEFDSYVRTANRSWQQKARRQRIMFRS